MRELFRSENEVVKEDALRSPLYVGDARSVQDADRLDAMGAIGTLPSTCLCSAGANPLLTLAGIMRCSAYSALISRPLYIPPPSPSSSGDATTPAEDYSTCALAHFDDKLLVLRERMRTDKGKEMARRRTEVLRSFKEEVEREWSEAVGQE